MFRAVQEPRDHTQRFEDLPHLGLDGAFLGLDEEDNQKRRYNSEQKRKDNIG